MEAIAEWLSIMAVLMVWAGGFALAGMVFGVGFAAGGALVDWLHDRVVRPDLNPDPGTSDAVRKDFWFDDEGCREAIARIKSYRSPSPIYASPPLTHYTVPRAPSADDEESRYFPGGLRW
jgi:hypothetical protein